MIHRSIKCVYCDYVIDVSIKNWEVTCPACFRKMMRKGAHEYCKCIHQQKEHTRTYQDKEGCSLCECLEFDSIRDYHPEEYDEFVKKCFCAHEFKKVSKRNEELKYVCKNCGCPYQGLKPSFWLVEEEPDENDETINRE